MIENTASQYQQLMGRIRDFVSHEREITLVAACKSQPREKVMTLLELRHSHFGENKVQEAMEKWPEIKAFYPQTELHLIGPLQSNKAREAVALFDVIETIDREKIADAVSSEAIKQKKKMLCLIQVNIGEEPQKAGASLEDLPVLIAYCRALQGLELKGLMCVPPAEEAPAPYFALMQKLAKEFELPWLSMGMSGDFETAIAFGATHIRVGTALFGERKPS